MSFTIKRMPKFNKVFLGGLKSLEVTYDGEKTMYYGNKKHHMKPKKAYYQRKGLKVGDLNPNYDMLHPHLHVLITVPKDYFKSDLYIKQPELCAAWASCLGLDYIPSCDIRKVTNHKRKLDKYFSYDFKSAVAEISKYSIKSGDYLAFDDDTNERIVDCLFTGTDNLKMFSFFGVMKEMRKKLNQGDIDGDLIHVDDDNVDHGKVIYTKFYVWVPSVKEYVIKDVIMSENILDIMPPGDDPPDIAI